MDRAEVLYTRAGRKRDPRSGDLNGRLPHAWTTASRRCKNRSGHGGFIMTPRNLIAALRWSPLFLFFFAAVHAQAPAPDLILHNGNIVTMEDKQPTAAAIAMQGEKILSLGPSEQILKLAGPQTKVVDLKGRTAIPGLIDTHIHIVSGGLGMVKVQLGEAESVADVLDIVRNHIRDNSVPAGAWVVASSDWYVNQLKENRFPTRWELDKAAPENPVFLPRGAHQSASNSLALKLAGITKDTVAPKGGEIGKDAKTGEPDGTLVDTAQEPIRKLLPREETGAALAALKRVQALAHSLGITSLVDGGVNMGEWRTMEELKKSGGLKIRIAARVRPKSPEDFREINKTLPPATGDQWLRTGLIKVTLDGGSTGALFHPAVRQQQRILRRPGQHDGVSARHLRSREPKRLAHEHTGRRLTRKNRSWAGAGPWSTAKTSAPIRSHA